MRDILIDDSLNMIRAAVVENGKLCEIMCESKTGNKLTESLFLGRVKTIRPSINAAFLDIGEELNAFLSLDECERIRCGDELIVQGANKQPTDSKGLRVTRKLNLAGKWLVLVPGGDGVHISKKVKDERQRNALFSAAQEICPQGCGLIVRTASADVTRERLSEEASMLELRWKHIVQKAAGMRKPGVLYERESLDQRLIRDMANGELSRIIINKKDKYETLLDLQCQGIIPEQTQIDYFEETEKLLFDAFDLETQIDKALRKRVWLPGGGYLVIDPCEALTVIDVNSGKMMLGQDIEETAFKVNMEAVEEIARQLRLRDIGGIIVVDFIDMREERHKTELVARMRHEVKKDRSHVIVEGISKLGLMEMTRKRIQTELRKAMRVSCSYCSGVGELISGDEVARRALRQVRRMVISGQRGPFVIRCAASAAQALSMINAPCAHVDVYVVQTPSRHAEKFELEQIGSGAVQPSGAKLLDKEIES